ncbi:hypothetical protein HQ590_12160, partial [bacterium]|nr:hypothetical protein [bacterium]
YALSKRIVLEIALIKAIKARTALGIDAVLRQLNELRQPAGSPEPGPDRGVPHPASGAAAAPDPAAPPAAALAEAWAYAVGHLAKVNALAGSYLVGTRPIGLRGKVLVVGFDAEFAERREFVDTGRNRELLQHKLKEKLHREVGLKFEVVDNLAPAAPPPGREAPAPGRPARSDPSSSKKNAADFRDDPLIKKALEVFKGHIVEVRQ